MMEDTYMKERATADYVCGSVDFGSTYQALKYLNIIS